MPFKATRREGRISWLVPNRFGAVFVFLFASIFVFSFVILLLFPSVFSFAFIFVFVFVFVLLLGPTGVIVCYLVVNTFKRSNGEQVPSECNQPDIYNVYFASRHRRI